TAALLLASYGQLPDVKLVRHDLRAEETDWVARCFCDPACAQRDQLQVPLDGHAVMVCDPGHVWNRAEQFAGRSLDIRQQSGIAQLCATYDELRHASTYTLSSRASVCV